MVTTISPGSYIGIGFGSATHGKGGDIVEVFVGPVVAVFKCGRTGFREGVQDEAGEAELFRWRKIAFYGFIEIGCGLHVILPQFAPVSRDSLAFSVAVFMSALRERRELRCPHVEIRGSQHRL